MHGYWVHSYLPTHRYISHWRRTTLPGPPPPPPRRISEELLPTPAKSHYTFNLRDLSKVFQGLLMITPSTCQSKDVMVRLWLHEACRVFHDRCAPGPGWQAGA